MTTKASSAYETRLVAILSITFGIAFFDRNAVSFLMPFIAPDLGLSNVHIGLLSSALSLTWAISGFTLGAISDATGKRKIFLVASVFVFSICSFLSGMATSFMMLFAARMLMGVSEGPMMPVSQSLVAAEVNPKRRGLYMGIMQNLGSNFLGSFAAPLVLVAIAEAFDWRVAFYLAGIPGLIAAFFIIKYIREPNVREHLFGADDDAAEHTVPDRMSILTMLGYRNMVICLMISVLLVAYTVIAWTFMPVYFVQVREFSPSTMSALMSVLGISATVCAFLVSGLSDRIGRKPAMIMFCLIGMLCPLATLYYEGSAYMLGALIFVGWAVNGTFPLFMATIPAETIPVRYVATAAGLAMGTGEVIGGFSGPAIAGWSADAFGLGTPLFIMTACSLVAAVLALALKETAPVKVGHAPATEAA